MGAGWSGYFGLLLCLAPLGKFHVELVAVLSVQVISIGSNAVVIEAITILAAGALLIKNFNVSLFCELHGVPLSFLE
jgi:hypothetical protein